MSIYQPLEQPDQPSHLTGSRNKRTLSERRRFEVQLWGLGLPGEIELLSIHREFLCAAGASDVFLTLFDADWVEDKGRDNPVRQEVRQAILYGDFEGDPEDFTHNGNRFFSAMWEGELYEAYRRHSGFIRGPLLEDVFGEDRIEATDIRNPAPCAEYGRSAPRYGLAGI